MKSLTLRHLSWKSWILPVLLLSIVLSARFAIPDAEPEVLGLRLGTDTASVRNLFDKRGIAVTEIGPAVFTAPRPLDPLDGVREVRAHFEKDRLSKIVLSFEIPPREPTADNLLLLYNKEKDRLKQLFGPPSLDFVDMQAPSPAERHEWLTRGRGYYRTIWKVKDQIDVSLWLFGEDAGIVLLEIYEKPETP
jgi:hypothetical protein